MKIHLLLTVFFLSSFILAQNDRSFKTSEDLNYDTNILDYSPALMDDNCSIMVKELNSVPKGLKLDDRKVLFEQGTNSGCGPCASYNPSITSFFHSMGDKIVAIRFHAYWPSNADPMYKYNTAQNRYFLSYMGINSVPWLDADGVEEDIYPFSSSNLTNIYNSRMKVRTNVFLNIEDRRVLGDSIKSTITVLVTDTLPVGNVRLRVAAIEGTITYTTPPGSNGEKVFEQVFRKAYPDQSGIEFKYAPGTYQFVYTYKIDPVWKDTMIYTVAWIQNDNTKEVLNSARGHYLNIPEYVELKSPLNNQGKVSLNPTLNWKKTNNAFYYSIQVADDDKFQHLIFAKDTVLTESIDLSGLEEGTTYYWRVKAGNDTLSTEYSTVWQFTTELNKPTNIEALSMCGVLELNWKDNSTKEIGYKIERRLYYSDSSSFSILATVLTDTTTYWYSVEDSSTYAYRIYAYNDNTASDYSDTTVISVTVDVKNEINTNYSFILKQNYPNPFNPTTKISYSIPSNGFVTLKVYNLLGQIVTTLVDKELQAGNYEVNFNASNLSSGTYFYELKAGNNISIKKMLLVK